MLMVLLIQIAGHDLRIQDPRNLSYISNGGITPVIPIVINVIVKTQTEIVSGSNF